jgi:hypothetical protein
MNNNLQNITLIILILILIIVILFYIRNSSLKHDELVEKYTNTTSIGNSIPDQSHTTVLTEVNRLSNFPSGGTIVTLRNCQVAFNNDKTSKYEYADEWKEIETIKEGSTSTIYTPVPVKIIGKDNTTNETDLDFVNFGERSRCFKKMDSTNADTYKYRYKDNALIKYDNQNYVSLTSNVNGVPTNNYYMEMKFDIPSSSNNYNYFANVEQSICSLNYSSSLGGSTNLGDTKLYRLKLKDDYIIEKLEKININPSNNHIFSNVTDIDLPSLLSTNKTSSYVYENGKFIYKVKSSVTGGAIGVNNINVDIYNFNRELFCNKDQGGVTYNNIKSYKIFGNKQLDVNKLILASSANKDADIPNTIFANARATPYDNKTKVLDHIKEVLKTQIDTANSPYRDAETNAQSNVDIAEGNRNAFITSINTKNKFINKYLTETDGTKLNYIKRNELITVDKLSYSSKNITDQENLIDSLSEPVFSQNDDDIYTVESFTYTTGTNTTNYTKDFSQNTICDILLVGGGGGGGHNHGGGGGAGAVVFIKSVVLNSGSYTIQVGKGGAKGTRSTTNFGGLKGIDTKITFNGTDILKAEGGGGGSQGSATGSIGNGGSGGGGDGYRDSLSVYNNGVVGTVSIKDYNGTTGVLYGNNGGSYYLATSGGYLNIAGAGGGGGGAGQIGNNATKCNVAGNAGNGISSATINGITYNFVDMFGTTYGTNDDSNNTTRYFGGGGGGGTWNTQGTTSAADTGPTVIAGSGGKGGGGAGALQALATGFDGSANTGGGGGGGSYNSTDSQVDGGNGGSGIVIIRYRNEPKQNGNEKQITFTFDKTKNIEYLAQQKTGVGGWRIVKFLPPNLGRWYQGNYISGNTVNVPNIGTAYNYSDEWGVPFGTFDEMLFGTFDMTYWLRSKKTSVLGNYSGEYRSVISSSKKSESYEVKWYNRGDGNPEDPWVSIDDHFITPSLMLYAENSSTYWGYLRDDYKYGGMCVLVRDSKTGTLVPIPNKYRVKINRSTRVKINNNQSYTLFDRGTYDIIMGNTKTEIVNTSNPSIVIGSYTNINELIFTYSINKTLNELNNENTVFNTIIPSIKNSTNYYSLGNKAIDTIVKYKININRIHSIDNHVLRVYVQISSGSIEEIVGDGRIIEKGSDDNGSIILTTYYITINKNISGNIYLTSEKQIFYVEESRRIDFNNTTEGGFTASINNLLNVNDELIILNNMFGVKTALDNKAAATAQIIKLNDSTTPISISYNSSTISRNSLNTLVTTFNNVNSFDETTVAGQLQSITNTHNFRNVLSPLTTNIDEYISYELATEKTPQTPTITSFNIKNTAQKYIYFKKL